MNLAPQAQFVLFNNTKSSHGDYMRDRKKKLPKKSALEIGVKVMEGRQAKSK